MRHEEEAVEQANAGAVPLVERWQTLPIEHKLYWLLRLGVIGCFIGHGAYGFITKEAWVPYFGVVGIDRAWAYRLMPWVGVMDVSLGLIMAVVPLRIVMLHLIVWGSLDGGAATTLGRFSVGVLRTSGQLWGATGLLGPRRCPVQPARLAHTSVAVHHAPTHRRQGAGDAPDPARHHLPAAARPRCARRTPQQAGADRTLCVYWPCMTSR